jgi:hypothetical protein
VLQNDAANIYFEVVSLSRCKPFNLAGVEQ